MDIKVYDLNVNAPADAVIVGTIKIGDTGFTVDYGYDVVLDKAKQKARELGGNAIKVIRHIPPGKSTCHRITVKVLRIHRYDRMPEIER